MNDNIKSSLLSSWMYILDRHRNSIVDFFCACRLVVEEYLYQKNYTEQEKFNLFHVISDLYYRENFHSDMIAFFLDPYANHGYKDLMLYNFIVLLNRSGFDIDATLYRDATVVREKEARIDILIKSELNKHAIIIENKINNAGDMPRQLPRYYDYVVKNYKLDAIVYLPLDNNKSPDTDGWTEVDKKHVFPLLKIIPAYDNTHGINIAEDWLLKSLPQIDNIDVVSSIRQYANLIITLNRNNMDTIVLEKFYHELLQADNLKTAQSIRNMLNDMPSYLAQRIQNKFREFCYPFEKIWIYNSRDAVFEKAVIEGIYIKMDIWCYEDHYDVLFWCPIEGQDENEFFSLVGRIHLLNDFEKMENVKNRMVKHFDFTEETALFDFIKKLLIELKEVISISTMEKS